MTKTSALAGALRNAGSKVAADAVPISEPAAKAVRPGTKAITVHLPEAVRRQLKALAGEEGRAVEDMASEAFNLLFARYRKPEIAPVKVRRP
jgi:hypothetical protein